MKLYIYATILCTIAATADAQVLSPMMRSPMRPVTERIQPWDCELPAVPGMPRQVITVKPGQLVEWCVANTGVDTARAAPWRASADGGAQAPLLHACRPTAVPGEAILCYAVLPAVITSQLALPGIHVLAVASIAINEGVGLTLEVERPSCMLDGVKYDVGAILPNTPQGIALGNLFTTTLGAFTAQSRIARLRQDGWHVEWTWVQWKNYVSVTDRGGGSVIFATCTGESWP